MNSVKKCDSRKPSDETAPAETAPVEPTEHAPLWQRVGDMFPEVKPQQSTAALDADTPF